LFNSAVASGSKKGYGLSMTVIRFPDAETEKRGFGYLIGRFSFKSWANGETIVPDEALPFLAREDIRFTVEGRATYDKIAPLRNFPAAAV
jgi:hypothetical protein